MKVGLLISFIILSCCGSNGQGEYNVPLPKENSALAVPSLARRGTKIYVAYRSFNWLRFSSRLEVLEYDLNTRKLLRRATVAVPKVHGPRPAQGLSLSDDGRTLAYVEAYNPTLVLLLSAGDLSVIRRSTKLPFMSDDSDRMFAGFCGYNLLAFVSVVDDGTLRLVRVSAESLEPTSSETIRGPKVLEPASHHVVWLPSEKLVWIKQAGFNPRPDVWRQYTEAGKPTGRQMSSSFVAGYGAIATGTNGLASFNGDMVAKGAVLAYSENHTSVLNLPCVPGPAGASDDGKYVGAVCQTMTDLGEPANNRVLSSEFLLLRTKPLAVVWRHKMSDVSVVARYGPYSPDMVIQEAVPLIFQEGRQIWIVAPSESPALNVFRIEVPQ